MLSILLLLSVEFQVSHFDSALWHGLFITVTHGGDLIPLDGGASVHLGLSPNNVKPLPAQATGLKRKEYVEMSPNAGR